MIAFNMSITVAADVGGEGWRISIASVLVKDIEPQPGMVKRKRRAQVVNDKKRCNCSQHRQRMFINSRQTQST